MVKIQRFQSYELVTALFLLVLFVFLLATRTHSNSRWGGQSICTGNLKQLGSASALYAGDNLGKVPGPQPLGVDQPQCSWDRPLAVQMGASVTMTEPVAGLTLRPPHGASKILMHFSCSSDPRYNGARTVPEIPGSMEDGLAAGNGICRSYSLNLGSGNPGTCQDGISAAASGISVFRLESCSGTVQLLDNHGYATTFGQRNIANDTTVTCDQNGDLEPDDAFTNPKAPMHGPRDCPRANALMYDGHVECLDQQSLYADNGKALRIIKQTDDSVSKPKAGAK